MITLGPTLYIIELHNVVYFEYFVEVKALKQCSVGIFLIYFKISKYAQFTFKILCALNLL